ncbi:hypothetical protein RUM44_010001 [Polyplax serrata]|uniref:Uncharacterized protein n=1 Tax=Polyplax serrata TaxID=468196 RepID=A0ABR1AUA9_POLSC
MSSEDDDVGEATRTEEGGEDGGDDECPPGPAEDKEMLFLIEFLVDTLLLKPENMNLQDMDPCLLQGQTCMVLTFIHFPPMSICENDMDPCKQTGGNYIKFNSGKSLMFALSESEFVNPKQVFLEVCAYKMLPHGTVPNKLPIGVTKICLVELFKQVFEKVDLKPDKLPVSKSIKDKYTLIGTNGKCPTAEVTIYIRLSCLGQNVVTEFQRGNDECEPFLFKSKESRKVYECKPKDGALEDEAEDLCPPLPGWGEVAGRDCGDGQRRPAGRAPQASQSAAYDRNDNTGGAAEGEGEAEFDEFGTEVHGHALTIKVQKSQRKQSEGNGSSPGSGNQVAFQVPQSQNLCQKGRGENRAPVYRLNSGGEGVCGGGNEPLRIIQGVDSPDKDIFVLRIGKKGESYAKGKLELELRTPKTKIERPLNVPRRTDRAVQTEKEEQPKKGKKKK